MVLDQLDVDCVTDPVGKPVGEVSRVDKKDRGPRPEVRRADARNDMCHPDRTLTKYRPVLFHIIRWPNGT